MNEMNRFYDSDKGRNRYITIFKLKYHHLLRKNKYKKKPRVPFDWTFTKKKKHAYIKAQHAINLRARGYKKWTFN